MAAKSNTSSRTLSGVSALGIEQRTADVTDTPTTLAPAMRLGVDGPAMVAAKRRALRELLKAEAFNLEDNLAEDLEQWLATVDLGGALRRAAESETSPIQALAGLIRIELAALQAEQAEQVEGHADAEMVMQQHAQRLAALEQIVRAWQRRSLEMRVQAVEAPDTALDVAFDASSDTSP